MLKHDSEASAGELTTNSVTTIAATRMGSLHPKSLEPRNRPRLGSRLGRVGRQICDRIGNALRRSTSYDAAMEPAWPRRPRAPVSARACGRRASSHDGRVARPVGSSSQPAKDYFAGYLAEADSAGLLKTLRQPSLKLARCR